MLTRAEIEDAPTTSLMDFLSSLEGSSGDAATAHTISRCKSIKGLVTIPVLFSRPSSTGVHVNGELASTGFLLKAKGGKHQQKHEGI